MSAAPQLVPFEIHALPAGLTAGAAARALSGSPRPRRPLRASDTADVERRSVLVVDPNERTRSVLAAGLGREGFTVIGVASAEEAQRYLSVENPLPAMIFCEAELRGGDGYSFCGQLRAQSRTQDLPVVLLSRAAEASHRERATGAGADEFLAKPVFLNDVVSLAVLLGGRSAAAAGYEAETSRLPLRKLMRAVLSGVRSGRVELDDGTGWVAFRDGQVLDAGWQTLRGEAALDRVLRWGRGAYSVVFGPAFTRSSINLGLRDFCRVTLPRLERWTKLVARAVPMTAVLRVAPEKAADALARLPEEVSPLLRLVDGERSVEAVVRLAGGDEVASLEHLTRLYAEGVLVPADALEDEPVPARRVEAVAAPVVDTPPGSNEGALRRERAASATKPVVAAPVAPAHDTSVRDQQAVAVTVAAAAAPVEAQRKLAAPVADSSLAASASVAHLARSLAAAAGAELNPPTPSKAPASTASASAPAAVPARAELTDDELLEAVRPRRTLLPRLLGAALVVAAVVFGIRFFDGARSAQFEPAVLAPLAVTAAPEPRPEAEPQVPQSAEVSTSDLDALSADETQTAGFGLAPEMLEGIRLYESGRFRNAVAVLEPLTLKNPEAVQAWLYLGLARFDLGDSEGAEAAVARVLSRDAENGRAIMLSAAIHLDMGRKDEAHAQLRRYLELYPDGPFAQDARQLQR